MSTSLPFRFQAGSKATSIGPHHHRSTTKVSQKSFKSKHATKGALKEKAKGRIATFEPGERKTPHQQVQTKLKTTRKNAAKQKRLQQHASRAKAGSMFAGRHGAAKVVAVISLGQTVDIGSALWELKSAESEESSRPAELDAGNVSWYVERFRQNMTLLSCGGDIMEVLELARMADYVLFVMDSVEPVSEQSETILRAVESQGISTVLACVQVCLFHLED
jgi:pre-rRNA-processing protein TSR1